MCIGMFRADAFCHSRTQSSLTTMTRRYAGPIVQIVGCAMVNACSVTSLQAATPSPSEPRAVLSFFVGAWTIRGSESTYSEVCDWLAGEGFVACHAEDRSDGSYSMSVFGYSEADQTYTYDGFGGNGTHRVLRGSKEPGVWRFFGESERAPDWQRWEVTMVPTADGFTLREAVSNRGGPWQEVAVIEYVRTTGTDGL